MNSQHKIKSITFLSCLIFLNSCDRKPSKKFDRPLKSQTIVTLESKSLESVPTSSESAKEWISSHVIPDLKCAQGWIEFSSDLPITGWDLQNNSKDYNFDKFLFDHEFASPGGVCIPVFARFDQWGLAFLKSQHKWVWIKSHSGDTLTASNPKNAGSYGTWPITSIDEEAFQDGWFLCLGTITSLTSESSIIRSEPNDHSAIILNLPVPKQINLVQPKFILPKQENTSGEEFSFIKNKYETINKSTYVNKNIVKILETRGDWIKIRPCDWEYGVWSVDSYDDVIGRILLKWHPSISGWVKWRVPGPVKYSHRVIIDVEILLGC